MSKIILAIHGLGNKPPNTLLTEWWKKSIQEGLSRIGKTISHIPLEMIYWADILYPQPLDINLKDSENPLYISEPYLPSSTKEKPAGKKFLTKILASIEQQLDRLFLNSDMTLNFENITNKIIHSYFSDLEKYYMADSGENTDLPAKEIIRERLQSALNKHRGKEILILSHSMGSIISFDVLSANQPVAEVNTLVTIGSPLGLPIIVSRIFAEQKKLRKETTFLKTPDSVLKRWVNVSDMEDNVALDHTLNDDFESNIHGVRAEDLFVYNDYEINGARNAHKIYGYLRTTEIAEVITSFMEEPETNWFTRLQEKVWDYWGQWVSKIKSVKTRGYQS